MPSSALSLILGGARLPLLSGAAVNPAPADGHAGQAPLMDEK